MYFVSLTLSLAHLLQYFLTVNEAPEAVGEQAMLNYLIIECMCAREFTRLISRDPRYLGLILSMYGRTLISPARTQMLGASIWTRKRRRCALLAWLPSTTGSDNKNLSFTLY